MHAFKVSSLIQILLADPCAYGLQLRLPEMCCQQIIRPQISVKSNFQCVSLVDVNVKFLAV